MTGAFANGDDVTLQQGPRTRGFYQCPKCHRIGRARRSPTCNGTTNDPHAGAQASPVSDEYENYLDHANPPKYT